MRHALFILLAVVGMLPGSLLPVVVSTARTGLGFSLPQAALLGGTAIFWTAVGALVIALVGVPAQWRRVTAAGLISLCLLDLMSMALSGFGPLLAVRACHGLVGGILTGIGYAAIGRTAVPDRLFGVLLAAQFLLGGLGIGLLPGFIQAAGPQLLFATLMGAALLVLAVVPLLPRFESGKRRQSERAFLSRLPRGRLLAGLGALFLFQAGHTSASAFMLELGRSYGMDLPLVQSLVGISAMAGVLGAVAAAAMGARYGRSMPIAVATVAGVVAGGLLLLAAPPAFAAGALIGSIAWAWSIPLVLGACATIDLDGRGAIWSSFVAKLGLAAGPLFGAMAVTGESYGGAIVLSCLLTTAGALIFRHVATAKPLSTATAG